MSKLSGVSGRVIYSLVESPSHPAFSRLYQSLGYNEQRFTNMRKAISTLKKQPPAVVVGEFFYGFGNNYAGVNVSNLDVFLHSLQKYAPESKVIVLVAKDQFQYVEKLAALFTLHATLVQPVSEAQMKQALADLN